MWCKIREEGLWRMSTPRIQLLEKTLQACTDEYKEKSTIFAALDSKAQNTISVSGIFLGAALAFIRADALADLVRTAGQPAVFLLGGAILSLLAAVVTCLIGMRVRAVAGPMGANTLAEMVGDLLTLKPSELDDIRLENHLQHQITIWQKTLEHTGRANENKGRTVFAGQLFLALAIVLVAFLLLIILNNAWLTAAR